jgi:hypothetical protein
MLEFFEAFGGIGLAFLARALRWGCAASSARGTGMEGEAATVLLTEAPEHYSKCLILHVHPGISGRLPGHLVLCLFTMGAFSGGSCPDRDPVQTILSPASMAIGAGRPPSTRAPRPPRTMWWLKSPTLGQGQSFSAAS